MAGTFPTLSSGEVCMYPTTRTVTVATRVLRTLNDSEQRWRTAPILSSWDLQFSRLKLADVNTLRTFFQVQKGSFDATWQFPFDGTTYLYMYFDSDDFTLTETDRMQYEVSLRIKQAKKSGTYDLDEPAAYPTINAGVITQLPFSTTYRYQTTRNVMPNGLVFTRAERDNPVRIWSCAYPMITNSEANKLMNFVTAMGGRHKTFDFTDPNTGTLYTGRLGQDEFRRQYVNTNQNSVTLLVEQVAA